MDIERFINWSKWNSPLGKSEDSPEYIPEKDLKNFDNDRNNVYADEDGDHEDDESPQPVVITPLGIIPVKPFNDITQIFNFWLGETTFSLTEKMCVIINQVPGVEVFDVFTRYKFRIAIGNNFKFQNVRQDIEKVLDAVPSKKKTEGGNMELTPLKKLQVQQLVQNKLMRFPYWAIYICPNGEIDMSVSHEQDKNFQESVEIYVVARELAGGAIYKYDEQLI